MYEKISKKISQTKKKLGIGKRKKYVNLTINVIEFK